jgi:hypothetical protein
MNSNYWIAEHLVADEQARIARRAEAWRRVGNARHNRRYNGTW